MLSKKIDFNFSNLFKKNDSDQVEESHAQDRRRTAVETGDTQTKVTGFAIGFLINLAIGAIILSIALVII